MKLAIIAALAHNRVIGNKGTIPWHYPEDLRRFYELTRGHTVIMGRRTFESLACKPLPERRNIIITSKIFRDIETYPSLQDALKNVINEHHVFIIGGSILFEEALPLVDELYLTLINDYYDGDTYFPEYENYIARNFILISKKSHPPLEFIYYQRQQ